MNEKGNVILFIILGFIVIAVIPPIFIALFPQAKLLISLILVFIIYSTVRMHLGEGILTLMVTGILIYLIVFKHPYLASSVIVLQFALMVGFTSAIVWGIARTAGG